MSAAFRLIASKQRVGLDDTAAAELPVLLHLDAAKRGQCNGAGHQFLTHHLIAAICVAKMMKCAPMVALVEKGYAALHKASARPTQLLDLTTTEYQAIRKALIAYFRAMPGLEIGVMVEAQETATQIMRQAA